MNGAGDSTALEWVRRLCTSANAGGASVTYYNLGIRGNTSKDILLRWKEESRANIREILRGAKSYKVLMVGPPPVEYNDQNERIKFLSQSFALEAASLNVPYIDLFSALVRDDTYMQDVSHNEGCYPKGFHPTSEGYSMIANIVGSSPSWWFHAP